MGKVTLDKLCFSLNCDVRDLLDFEDEKK
ncbi:MAG: helix-turn-helix domain-containing protein [Pyrinomonadaceae bacterium]